MKLIGQTIEILEKAINIRSRRNTVLAGNIANIDTPGYVPRDINFKKVMESYMPEDAKPDTAGPGPVELSATDPRHFTQASPDENADSVSFSTERGTPNSLDLDQEMARLSANNLQYQADVTVLIKKFENIMTAITEGGKQ